LPDAVVVGSGPNGLAAAIVLARAGRRVTVLEGQATLGGGCRSAELTLPGFVHDTCSTVHSLALASPFLRMLPLAEHGFEPVHPEAPLAHPLDDGTAVMLERSAGQTAAGLGADGAAYLSLVEPLVRAPGAFFEEVLAPPRHVPRHPLLLARFARSGLRSASALARSRFGGERARALFAGCAAHSFLPLEAPLSAGFGLVLAATAHSVGWPVARGGSQRLADALAAHLRSLGATIETGRTVSSLAELGPAAPVLLDVTSRQLHSLSGGRVPDRHRPGPGVFKLDWALAGPIPWRAPEAGRAGTVHLGGTLEEIEASERGGHSERPFVLLVQPTPFDPSRAPAGRHTAWAYCHVPNRSTRDMTAAIEAQVERFAPGFGERILARSAMDSAEVERRNPNYVGGDIVGGLNDLRALALPLAYRTPLSGVFLCSSSTPPGGGVHGMCGYWAARAALRRSRRSGRGRAARSGRR
jgi:phytoene dehydrogenase-like protein